MAARYVLLYRHSVRITSAAVTVLPERSVRPLVTSVGSDIFRVVTKLIGPLFNGYREKSKGQTCLCNNDELRIIRHAKHRPFHRLGLLWVRIWFKLIDIIERFRIEWNNFLPPLSIFLSKRIKNRVFKIFGDFLKETNVKSYIYIFNERSYNYRFIWYRIYYTVYWAHRAKPT